MNKPVDRETAARRRYLLDSRNGRDRIYRADTGETVFVFEQHDEWVMPTLRALNGEAEPLDTHTRRLRRPRRQRSEVCNGVAHLGQLALVRLLEEP